MCNLLKHFIPLIVTFPGKNCTKVTRKILIWLETIIVYIFSCQCFISIIWSYFFFHLNQDMIQVSTHCWLCTGLERDGRYTAKHLDLNSFFCCYPVEINVMRLSKYTYILIRIHIQTYSYIQPHHNSMSESNLGDIFIMFYGPKEIYVLYC